MMPISLVSVLQCQAGAALSRAHGRSWTDARPSQLVGYEIAAGSAGGLNSLARSSTSWKPFFVGGGMRGLVDAAVEPGSPRSFYGPNRCGNVGYRVASAFEAMWRPAWLRCPAGQLLALPAAGLLSCPIRMPGWFQRNAGCCGGGGHLVKVHLPVCG